MFDPYMTYEPNKRDLLPSAYPTEHPDVATLVSYPRGLGCVRGVLHRAPAGSARLPRCRRGKLHCANIENFFDVPRGESAAKDLEDLGYDLRAIVAKNLGHIDPLPRFAVVQRPHRPRELVSIGSTPSAARATRIEN